MRNRFSLSLCYGVKYSIYKFSYNKTKSSRNCVESLIVSKEISQQTDCAIYFLWAQATLSLLWTWFWVKGSTWAAWSVGGTATHNSPLNGVSVFPMTKESMRIQHSIHLKQDSYWVLGNCTRLDSFILVYFSHKKHFHKVCQETDCKHAN